MHESGIISSLAFCPDYSGLYAAGTFSSSLVLFSESSGAEIIQSLGGVMGPVTQVCDCLSTMVLARVQLQSS